MNRPSLDRVREILERARDVPLLVVGDVMLDRYVSGRVDRISPEAPVPVVRVEDASTAVGGAGNVAANVVALGARCHLVGCVGDDEHGEILRSAVEDLGVETDGLVSTSERPTTVKTRILARRQQVVRVDQEDDGDLSPSLADRVKEIARSLAPEARAIVMEDYNKGILVEAVIHAALGVGVEEGIPTVVDPKRIRFFEYRGATVFKPNAKELADALGARLEPDDPGWTPRGDTWSARTSC